MARTWKDGSHGRKHKKSKGSDRGENRTRRWGNEETPDAGYFLAPRDSKKENRSRRPEGDRS
jgi:hypothetical protein